MLNLADICNTANIHLTTYATGCIFHYDKDFPENSGKGFTEEDTPNFTGSYYSYTKVSLAICALSSRLCMTCRVPVGLQHVQILPGMSRQLLSASARPLVSVFQATIYAKKTCRQWWRAS